MPYVQRFGLSRLSPLNMTEKEEKKEPASDIIENNNSEKSSNNWWDYTSDVLTAGGMVPGFGAVPDIINTVGNLGAAGYSAVTGGDTKKYLTNAALSAAAIIPVAGQAVSGGKLAGKIIPKAIKNSKAAQGGGKIAKATKKVKDLAPYLMSTSNEADKYTGYVPAEKTSKEPKIAI